MKHLNLLLILALLATFAQTGISQNTYYVDTNSLGGNCSYSNPGTESSPFCNMSKITDMVYNGQINAGDIIYIRAGVYPSFSINSIAGTAGNRIVIRNYPGETPVIDATHPNSSTNEYAVRLNNSNYIEINGLEIINAYGAYVGGLTLNSAEHNLIINNHIHDNRQGNNETWTSGIRLYASSYNIIQNNEIHDNNQNGIQTSSSNDNSSQFSIQNQYLNNHIYNHSGMTEHSDGIGFYGAYTSNCIISSNLVHDNEDDGIDTWSSNNHTITHNIVYNSGQMGVGDGNGFKLGGANQGTVPGYHFVAYNISYNNASDGYDMNGSGGSVLYNNIAYDNIAAGIEDGWRADQTTPNELRNNILMDNQDGGASLSQYSSNSDYNLYYQSNNADPLVRYDYSNYYNLSDYQNINPNEANSLAANPQFVNITAANLADYDFQLQSGSPAIDTGDPTNPGAETYTGAAPDMGVYEYQDQGLQLAVKFFLEGAYDVNTNLMRDDLRTTEVLPAANPWVLSSNIPASALAVEGDDALVDWVLVELRAVNDLSTVLYTTSGLVQRDGDLVDFDGVSLVAIDYPLPNTFHIFIQHKNHLPAMSASPITLVGSTATFDFTTQNTYQGSGVGQKELSPGVWGLYTGNSSGDQDINGQDKALWNTENGLFGLYAPNDFNMDGEVNGGDKAYWNENNGLFSLIP